MVPDPANPSEPPSRDERLRSLRRKLLKASRALMPDGSRESVREWESASARDQKAPGNADALTLPHSHAPTALPPSLAPPASGLSALPPGSIVYRRDLPRVAPPRAPKDGGICIPLGALVAGSEAVSGSGLLYLVERSIAETEPDSAELPGALAGALEALSREPWPESGVGAGPRARPAHEEGQAQGPAPTVHPESVCFLDIETTGLGSTPVFLIGVLVWREGALVCRQFLARTYAEEAAILDLFAAELRRSPVLVTFNGKTFDVPYLRCRAAATGVPFAEPSRHLDLLHLSRRHFRGTLPDCRLQTLERYVCRRTRGPDIPGHEIPRAYHQFVRTGDASEMAIIIRHNQSDLLTMAHLVTKLAIRNP